MNQASQCFADATIHQQAGRFYEAAQCYRQAIQLDPSFAEAYSNLGLILAERGRLEGAALCFLAAIQHKPESADVYFNLGNLRLMQGRFDEAADLLQRALEIQPNDSGVKLNLANVFHRQGKFDEAIAICDALIEANPTLADAYATRGDCLKGMARVSEAIGAFRRVLELRPDAIERHSALLFALHFCPGVDAAGIYAEHCRANEQHTAALSRFVEPHENEPDPNRRLRLGYVSPNFHYHCQAYFTTPLLLHHDHQQFEIFCYSKTARIDDATQFVHSRADHWRDIYGLPDGPAADLVRQDGIDILVDLTMHMDLSSLPLFARKPAPVQVCWLAYPGTTGVTAIDYRLTDPYLDPPGLFDRYYSEESIRLPHCFWCYDPLTSEPGVSRLPALANGHVTFGCLSSFFKLNADVLRLWSAVMNAVDGSRLVLLASEGSARRWVLDFLAARGISSERITFVPFQKRGEYLATYHWIDIVLETIPYNGHTTSLDAFWMGVPVPTLVGQTVVGRAGVCLLENLGLPGLIAKTDDEYVAVVSGLAGDLQRLGELRAGLRNRMERSPLMNAPQFARDIEVAYRQVWWRWCEGKRR
jgi:protein O-GlcNAc transferase